MSWYYSKNGTQLGPVSKEELVEKCTRGDVSMTDLVWKEGMPDWKQAGQMPDLGGISNSSTAPPPLSQENVPLAQPPRMNSAELRHVPNYLWQSIAATCLCCLPFGVVGIVYAAKVDSLVARGDLAGAQAASSSAKLWTSLSVGLGA